MKILIKKYCLSHNKRIYSAGETVDIEDAALAQKLVANSNGSFELLDGVSGNAGKTTYAHGAMSAENVSEPITQPETVSDNVRGNDEEEDAAVAPAMAAELPAVDFADTVKKTTSGKRK